MIDELSDDQWLTDLFEYEFCSECGGDAEHHRVILSPVGNRFAQCQYPRDEDGCRNPVIKEFHKMKFGSRSEMTLEIKRVMRDKLLIGQCIDPLTGIANLTELAELTAHELNHDEWLDDEFHEIWDCAIEVSDELGLGER